MQEVKPIAQHLPSSQPESEQEPFNEIKLTDEETAEALRKARENKYYRLKEAAYWENVAKSREMVKFTAEQLFEHAKKRIDVDPDNEWIVKALCLYFTGDSRFENLSPSFSLRKGLYLFGGVGVGKTFLMELFFQNQVQSYTVISARKIESEFGQKEGGEAALSYYSHIIQVPMNGNPYGHTSIGLCIDDIGTESEGKHFGKSKNVITEIILNRYDNRLAGNLTHVTTNLTADEVEQFYGTRVRDRMREMFNLIEFNENAKSRRK